MSFSPFNLNLILTPTARWDQFPLYIPNVETNIQVLFRIWGPFRVWSTWPNTIIYFMSRWAIPSRVSLFKESEITKSDIEYLILVRSQKKKKKKGHQCSLSFVSLYPTCYVKRRVFTELSHCNKVLLKTFLMKIECCDLFLRFFTSFFIHGFNHRLGSSCCKWFVWITVCGFCYHGWLMWLYILVLNFFWN